MKMIDTHTHIYLEEFRDDLEPMLARAAAAGVEEMYLPAIDSRTHEAMHELEKSHPNTCFAMMGLHPCSVKNDYISELNIVKEYLSARKYVAVGEIGLDYHWDKTFVEEQKNAFRQQIEWAIEYNIPISIHSRDATQAAIEIVGEYQGSGLSGVFHCFGGTVKEAEAIIDLGFYLGIGGVLTYKNSGLAAVLREIPLEKIVLETDAPYLSPVPFRGKRNEPAYMKEVLVNLAHVYGMSDAEVDMVTSKNAKKLFKRN
jgi:TatD DNase family protein